MQIDINSENNMIKTQIHHSWEAESYIEIFKEKATESACWWILGFHKGVLESYLNKKISAVETKCFAKGDPYCEFEVTLQENR